MRSSPGSSWAASWDSWFPGNSAPSIDPKAATVDARRLDRIRAAREPHDVARRARLPPRQQRQDAPDLSRLRSGDRLALGLSDSHAALIALGAAYRAAQNIEVFGELSGDLLIGSHAPKLTQSPLRVAAGGRYFFSRALQAELTSIVSLSGRPGHGARRSARSDRAALRDHARRALRAAFHRTQGQARRVRSARRAARGDRERRHAATPSETNATATLEGVLTDDHGAPLPEAHVKASAGDQSREAITDGEGRYHFADVPVGTVMLEASATGFETQSWEVELTEDAKPEAPRALAPEQETGVLRGLTRSFGSEPLRAHIVVRDRSTARSPTRAPTSTAASRSSSRPACTRLRSARPAIARTVAASRFRTTVSRS